MSEKIYKCLEIKDLKDMLKKSGEKYGEKNAYKIRLEKNKYNPDRCIETIDMYFSNELKKEKNKNIHNEKKSIEDFANYIQYILKAPLKSVLGLNEISEVMGISVSELIEEKDEEIIKINYLLNLIKYEKKGKED